MVIPYSHSDTMKYTRYMSDIPINIRKESVALCSDKSMRNISFGGLCFAANAALKKDIVLSVEITSIQPAFRSKARVAWCNPSGKGYMVGIEFVDAKKEARVAMMQQVCDIEHYRNIVQRKTGKKLSGEQAATEWRREHDDYLNFIE